ncbi:MAG: EF-hand domain-containing protein [Gammaproteobacteria bacterium]|nr:EF-hand domain-containing protein [Gammaproteobacteria bacterium]
MIAREQNMVLKNIRLERSKANGMIVTFILCGSVMNCRLAEAQKPQISTAKQKQDGGRDTGDRQLKKSGGQKGGGQKGGGQGGGLFRLLDINRDDMLSKTEINNAFNVLKMLDVNRNGVLDPQELVVRGGGSGKGGKKKRTVGEK